ncbi:helix-turn-helix domain-containing protein [Acetohalobium arabaticum]|uniref:Cytoskeleton protein RodZ-like C-terminal domain-containing protein n=1 Tax=Acetohalobium arabaticum (strain ATCC 49924 / DSM 5501 / Z-7288) TaxID=574087 RepID=D9QRC4_ACEAZ|nr:RodZ domain-containing protein [Acetohalobium arabaticum]ADL13065.1 conserved hypothetical protein [Acetohalobium arabaticum DSM 5501]
MGDMEELGQKIRQARLDRGITIDKVQKSTKIRKKYLKAIEAGDFEVISQEVFLKGFLRVYANYVGLDGQEILNEYNELIDLRQEVKKGKTEIEEDESTAEKVLCFISNHLMKIVAAVVILLMVFLGGTILYKQGIIGNLTQTEQSNMILSEEKKDNTSQESVSTGIEADTNKQEIKVKDRNTEPSKRNITIKVLETSWIKVVVDGKIVLEEMLSSGTERSWHADRSVEFLSANAAGVKVVLNGEAFGPFGRQGEVIERKFTLKSE